VNTLEVDRAEFDVLCPLLSVAGIPGRKVFSYNKRTMDRAMFLQRVRLHGIAVLPDLGQPGSGRGHSRADATRQNRYEAETQLRRSTRVGGS
jgi:hypothetical protein